MGTLIGSTFRNALCSDFNGTDEHAYHDDPSFDANTAGAWSFWVKIDAVFGSDSVDGVIGFGVRDAGNNSQFFIGPRRNAATGTGTYMNITHRPTHNATANGVSAVTTALSAGVWYHVVAQSNGTAWSMYINGTAQTITVWSLGTNTGDWYGDVSGSDHRFAIGANYVSNAIGTAVYAGLVDEVVYLPGRVFTGAEVTEIYNAGVPKNPHRLSMASELTTWYRMGDSRDDATTIYDEIGSNNLTLVNMDASNYVAT